MKKDPEQITRYADMFAAMGTESRLHIMQLLLSAHPDGLVVGKDPVSDAKRFRRTANGICLITKTMIDELHA